MADTDKKEIGYQLSYAAQVDPENQDQLQLHANAPVGATPTELAAVIATMRSAVWLERIACNERSLEATRKMKESREARVEQFRERGEKLDEDMINDAAQIEDTQIVNLSAKLDGMRAAHTNGVLE